MTVIGYARVSTDKSEQDASIEAQVEQLRAAGCDRVICERSSAFREGGRRPGWDELQALVAAGRVSEVVAVSQSRLSRRGDEVQFLRICARRGVAVRFLDGTPGDVTDPAGRLMTGVLATVNEVDSLIKSINTRNGLARRKQAGHYACGRVPYGYLYDGSGVIPNPETWADARLLWNQLVKAEMSANRVIRLCDRQWSSRGLYRWIENPILRGIVAGRANATTALVTWDEWRAAMELRRRRQRTCSRAPRQRRPFSGLVRCGACDRRLHYLMVAGRPRMKCTWMHCRWYGRGLAEWKIREQTLDALRGGIERAAKVAAAETGPVASPERAQWQEQLDQLQGLRASGVPGLEQSIDELERRLLEPEPSATVDWRSFAVLLSRPGALEAATDAELREILLEVLDEIVYIGNPNRVEIRLRD